jgi:hypothetical protein
MRLVPIVVLVKPETQAALEKACEGYGLTDDAEHTMVRNGWTVESLVGGQLIAQSLEEAT